MRRPGLFGRVFSHVDERVLRAVVTATGSEAVATYFSLVVPTTFGDRWAKRGMPAELKEMMRHESIETTLRYYVCSNAERTAETCWQRAPGADDAYAKAFASETCNGLGNTTPAGVAANP